MINLAEESAILGWLIGHAPSLNDRSDPNGIHCGPARAVEVMGLPQRVPNKNVIHLTTSRRVDDQELDALGAQWRGMRKYRRIRGSNCDASPMSREMVERRTIELEMSAHS